MRNLYRAPRLTLPHIHQKGLMEAERQAHIRITGQETVLETASVDVAKREEIVLGLREKILPKSINENSVPRETRNLIRK